MKLRRTHTHRSGPSAAAVPVNRSWGPAIANIHPLTQQMPNYREHRQEQAGDDEPDEHDRVAKPNDGHMRRGPRHDLEAKPRAAESLGNDWICRLTISSRLWARLMALGRGLDGHRFLSSRYHHG